MWIELREPIKGLFFPSETLQAGAVISIGDPRAKKLIAAGKAVQVAFPGSGDPDDVDRLRKQYREANDNQPLWDEQQLRPVTAFALQRPTFAQTLVSSIEQKLASQREIPAQSASRLSFGR